MGEGLRLSGQGELEAEWDFPHCSLLPLVWHDQSISWGLQTPWVAKGGGKSGSVQEGL